MRSPAAASRLYFCIVIAAIFACCPGYSQNESDIPAGYSFFSKSRMRLGSYAKYTDDNFVSIKNTTDRNLYLVGQKWRSDSIDIDGYITDGFMYLPNVGNVIIPPKDSVLVKVLACLKVDVTNIEGAGVLKAYFVFEGENLLREDSIQVRVIKRDNIDEVIEKTSIHSLYANDPAGCHYFAQAPVVMTSLKNNLPRKTLYIDGVRIASESGAPLNVKRYLWHTKSYVNDSIGDKMYPNSILNYSICYDPNITKSDVITSEVILRDSASNQVFFKRDTLRAIVYEVSMLKNPNGYYLWEFDRKMQVGLAVSFYVCPEREVVIDSLSFYPPEALDFFKITYQADLPLDTKEAQSYRKPKETVLCKTNFNTADIDCDKKLLVAASYINLSDGSRGYSYFPIIISAKPFKGVEEARELKSFVYPNPASEYIAINVESAFDYGMLDMFGRPVASGKSAPNGRIDVSNLPAGTYFLRINDGFVSHRAYRFVISR